MFCLWIAFTAALVLLALPRNPLAASVSVFVFLNVLNTSKSVALLVLLELSNNVFGCICIFIWSASLAKPVPLIVTVYWSPILVVPSSVYTGVTVPTFTETFDETSCPFTRTFILLAVRLLLLKYLSVPFTVIVAVWSAALAVELTLSHIGSTTSTIVPFPVTGCPLTSIPDVIVTALFLLLDVSDNLSLGIATVIIPL